MGLFDAQVSRKPNLYPETQKFIDAIWHNHWTPDEFNFKSDFNQFNSVLTAEEKEIVTKTLSAIAQIEVAVKRFWADLGNNLPHPSVTDLGFVMANNEVVHNQAYEKLLTILGLEGIFEENLKKDVVAGRVKYLRKYLEKNFKDNKKQYIYSICLFTLFVENVSLFSQFYIIKYFSRFKNYLKDTSQQVDYTIREESLHAQVGIYLIKKLREEYPELFDEELENRIREECLEAYKSECKIIDWILGDYKENQLDPAVIKVYIKNRLLSSMADIGINKVPVELELTDEEKLLLSQSFWMEEETLGSVRTDFFHKRPVEYSRGQQTYDNLFGG